MMPTGHVCNGYVVAFPYYRCIHCGKLFKKDWK